MVEQFIFRFLRPPSHHFGSASSVREAWQRALAEEKQLETIPSCFFHIPPKKEKTKDLVRSLLDVFICAKAQRHLFKRLWAFPLNIHSCCRTSLPLAAAKAKARRTLSQAYRVFYFRFFCMFLESTPLESFWFLFCLTKTQIWCK